MSMSRSARMQTNPRLAPVKTDAEIGFTGEDRAQYEATLRCRAMLARIDPQEAKYIGFRGCAMKMERWLERKYGLHGVSCLAEADAEYAACLGIADDEKENIVTKSAEVCEVAKCQTNKHKKKERRRQRVCEREQIAAAAVIEKLEKERSKGSTTVSVETTVEAAPAAGMAAEAKQAGAAMEAANEAGTAAATKANKEKRRRAARRAKEKQRKLVVNI